ASFGCIANTRTVRAACAGAAIARAASRRAATLGERVDARGELEVVLRQAALGVRRECEVDRVPRDRDVGVVVHLLRRRRDPVDEVDRPREVAELELPLYRVALAAPLGQPVQPSFDLVVAQKWHG